MAHRLNSSLASLPGQRLTRRQALRLAAVTGFGVVGATMLPGLTVAPTFAATAPLIVGKNIDDIINLDPHVAYEDTFAWVLHNCYDQLVSIQPDDPSTIVARLATNWNVSPDAKVFTFTLRDANFSSGNPVTSADVKFSFERLRELKGGPAFLMDPVDAIETPDPKTVTFKLKDSDSTFLAALTSQNASVVDMKVVQANGGTNQPGADKNDKATDWLNHNSAGSGPFILTGWTPKDRVTFKRNPNSWNPPMLDEVVLQGVPEAATLKQMVERGDVDIAWGLLPEQVQALTAGSNVNIASTPMLGWNGLAFTRDSSVHEAAANPDVELALKYAIDYDGIRSLMDGARVPPGVVPIGLGGALDPATDGIKMDVQKAKDMLAAAGYPDGFDVTLTFSSDWVFGGIKHSTLAEKLQADLAQVNVRVQLEPLESSVYFDKWRAMKAEMALAAYYIDYPHGLPIITIYSPVGLITKRINWHEDNHPVIPLIEQARKTIDAATQIELMQEAQRTEIQDGPIVPLIQPVLSYAYRANITGIIANSMWHFDPAVIAKA